MKNIKTPITQGKEMNMKQPVEHYENRAGGKGMVHIERLLTPEEMGPNVKMYAKVTVDVNSSLGYHPHNGDSETYYILEGTASYNDNGNIRTVTVGDVTHTPSGQSHGIENIGDQPLVFMALIIASE